MTAKRAASAQSNTSITRPPGTLEYAFGYSNLHSLGTGPVRRIAFRRMESPEALPSVTAKR
ncbi:hypothetical protein KXR72_20260, partial [Stutzerimonas chloritidismutans]|uniref:hypothetical protein n=1 Tax=Stutzerimonas chloritidismutans TaxID=203192 RepID=UPI003F1495C4